MEKNASSPAPLGVCERLFHAFQLHPTIRRLPFRQQEPVTPAPAPTPVSTNLQNPTPQKQEVPALLPVQSMKPQKQPPPPNLQTQAKEVPPPPPSKSPTKVEPVLSAKAPPASPPPPPPPAIEERIEPQKSLEGAKTRRGINQKVDDYISRTKNRMKSTGSSLGRMSTKVRE